MSSPSNVASPPPAAPVARFWRLAAALAVVLLLVLFAGPFLVPSGAASDGEDSELSFRQGKAKSVSVVVRRPEAEEAQSAAAWREGMTVAEATLFATKSEWRGQGEMAFLESLDGVPNQGPDGLNWQFEVNGEYGERGAGATPVAPGDQIEWRLAPYE